MTKKYVVYIVLGFIVILLLGIATEKVFKPKRTHAPEVEQADSQLNVPTKKTDSNKQADTSRLADWQIMPSEVSAESAEVESIPAAAKALIVEKLSPTAKVFSVAFAGGGTGYRVEQTTAKSLPDAQSSWKAFVMEDHSVWHFQTTLEKSLYEFEKDGYKVLVTLTKDPSAKTEEVIVVLPVK